MNVLQALATRRSPLRLADPAPPQEVLDAAFEAALNAPDHGRLRPWKILQIAGSARRALGALMAAAAKRRNPAATDGDLSREADKALRAPLILVIAAITKAGHKVPVIEQVMSGACVAENLILALHGQGFGCLWKTGAPAYDSQVKRSLGLAESDQIIGFLYAGTVQAPALEAARPRIADHVVSWRGPADA